MWFAAAVELGWSPVPERWFTDFIEPACADTVALWLENKMTGKRKRRCGHCVSWRCWPAHRRRRVDIWADGFMAVAPERVWQGMTTRESWDRLRDRKEHPAGAHVFAVGHDRLLVLADSDPTVKSGDKYPRGSLREPLSSLKDGAGICPHCGRPSRRKKGGPCDACRKVIERGGDPAQPRKRGPRRKPVEIAGRWVSRSQAIAEVRALAVDMAAVTEYWPVGRWRPEPEPDKQHRLLHAGHTRTQALAEALAASLYGAAFPDRVDLVRVLGDFEPKARRARCDLCGERMTRRADYGRAVAERGLLFCGGCFDHRVPEVQEMVRTRGDGLTCDSCGKDVTMRVTEHVCAEEERRARR